MSVKLTKKQIRQGAIGKCLGMEQVWCFVGDMASEMGIFHECLKYARGEDLPITFIIEDNGVGCYTPTKDVWKEPNTYNIEDLRKLDGYTYTRTYPHYGIGSWINF
jgi:TPP-dependent pyruvate/acetoin dehydrogenase alpha subunit